MSRNEIIEKAIAALNKLPEDRAEEVADFIDFLLSKYEAQQLQKGIHSLTSDSETFQFLKEDEELYTVDDKQHQ